MAEAAGIKIIYVDSPANVEAEATVSTDNKAGGQKAAHPYRELMSEDCFVLGKNEPFSLQEGRYLYLTHDLFDHDAIILTNIPEQVTLGSEKCNKKDYSKICTDEIPWNLAQTRKKNELCVYRTLEFSAFQKRNCGRH